MEMIMGNQYTEFAMRLRSDTFVKYNCAQAVLVPFADACGIRAEQAYLLGMHFGGGMKMASVCGAITGGLMVIGMLGGGDEQYRAFMKAMHESHDGMVECRDLLKRNKELGGEKRPHCDAMICEAAELVVRVMGGTEQGPCNANARLAELNRMIRELKMNEGLNGSLSESEA